MVLESRKFRQGANSMQNTVTAELVVLTMTLCAAGYTRTMAQVSCTLDELKIPFGCPPILGPVCDFGSDCITGQAESFGSVTILGNVVAYSGATRADAVASGIGYVICSGDCMYTDLDLCAIGESWLNSLEEPETFVTSVADASAYAFDGFGLGHAEAAVEISGGVTVTIDSLLVVDSDTSVFGRPGLDECCSRTLATDFGGAAGGKATAIAEFDPPATTSATVAIQYISLYPCVPGQGASPSQLSRRGSSCEELVCGITDVHFDAFVINWILSDGSSESWVSQGLLTRYDDGRVVALGHYDDDVFIPTGNGIDGSLELVVSPAMPTSSVDVDVTRDSFTTFDGDVDQDGRTCSKDEGVLVDLLGTLLGCFEYLPRADFDTNGIIDEIDLTMFTTFFNFADANRDGCADPLDVGYALARFGCDIADEDCQAADANCDSTVDPLDVGFILARLGSDVGACCDTASSTCTEGAFEDCEYEWHGCGTSCDDFTCAPAGACCDLGDVTCTVVSQSECDGRNDLYYGDGTDCSQVTCPTDCCTVHTPPGCDSLGGIPDETVDDCVCAVDPYCCEFEWDGACVLEVEQLGCGDCPD